MTTTNNAPISFRLTDDELELLRQHQEDGEKSLNLTAKRLLLNALGVDAKKPSIQVVNSVDMVHVQELIETAVQEKLEKLTIVDNVDIFKKLIDESLADGDIKDAIATSYEAAMGQFNGLLEELQDLKKQVEELKSIPPAAVPSSQSTTDNEELTTEDVELTTLDDLTEIKSDNSPIANYQSPTDNEELTTDNVESDRLDSENKSDNPPAVPTKNQADWIQKQLKKNGISKTAKQIREAFKSLGFDGTNYDLIREDVIIFLSNE